MNVMYREEFHTASKTYPIRTGKYILNIDYGRNIIVQPDGYVTG